MHKKLLNKCLLGSVLETEIKSGNNIPALIEFSVSMEKEEYINNKSIR